MNISKNENCAVDIMKYFMSILVIIIHKPILNTDLEFQNYLIGNVLCSIAVPFFFIASSYFFFSKLERNKSDSGRLLKFEKRLFIMYAIWTVIYIPCILVKYNTGHYNELTLKLFVGQLITIVKNFFLNASFVHFWYLNTLMLSVAIIYLMYKKLGPKAVFAICVSVTIALRLLTYMSSMGISIGQIYTSYVPSLFRNTLEKGLLSVSIGLLLCKADFSQNRIQKIFILSLSFISMTACGVFIYKNDNEIYQTIFYFLVVITSASVFSLCMNIQLKPKVCYVYMRKASTLIYLSQLLLMSETFRYLSDLTGIKALSTSKPLIFFITFLFAHLVSFIIIELSKKEKLKFLKYLY